MKTYIYESHSLKETQQLAYELGRAVKLGDIILLEGQLGAGKTSFAQGFARGLGVIETVNSPTFTIIKEYEGRIPLYHMDVYRLSLEEAEELGLDEYFYGEGVTLIEWASVIRELIPSSYLMLEFTHLDENQRQINLTTNIPHLQKFNEEVYCLHEYIGN